MIYDENELGYIKVHRKIMDSEIWSDPVKYKLWSYCLLKASFTNRSVIINEQKIELLPGQFVTGRFLLEEEFNKGSKNRNRVSGISLMRYLKTFASLGMLNIKTSTRYTLITVLNWNVYQESEQRTDNEPTTDRQRTDTNKNVKNVKNDKNVKDLKYIVDYLNLRTSKKYRLTDSTSSKITARLNEGFTLDDFKTVIDKKCVEWSGTKMAKFLRPETLFSPKFDSYLNQDVTKPKSGNPFLDMLREGEFDE